MCVSGASVGTPFRPCQPSGAQPLSRCRPQRGGVKKKNSFFYLPHVSRRDRQPLSVAFVPWASNQQCQPATTSVGAFLSPASDPAGNSPNSSPTMKVLHRKSTPGLWRCLPAGEVQVRCAAKFCSLPACCSREIFTQGETRPLRRSTRATRGVLPQERQERPVSFFNQRRV